MFEFIGRIVAGILVCAFALLPTSLALSLAGASDVVVILVPIAGALTGKIGLDAFECIIREKKAA